MESRREPAADFFSNVSHEFRTPLTLIMGPVAELCAAPAVAADPRLREELDVIHRHALRVPTRAA